jgi:hypothetical protein
MASRNLINKISSLDRDMVVLTGGATGGGNDTNMTAVTGPGFASVAQVGASDSGTYTVTLTDVWQNILAVIPTIVDGNATPRPWSVVVTSKSASAKTIGIATFLDGVAADLETDCKLSLVVIVGNTNQPAGATRP